MLKLDGLSSFERNESLEKEQGVDFPITDTFGVRILRAGGSNQKYFRSFSRHSKPYQRQMERDKENLDEETSRKVMANVYADAVIIGWWGAEADGKEVPFTRENVIAFLLAYPEIFTDIRDAADSMATFRQKELEEVAENLGN